MLPGDGLAPEARYGTRSLADYWGDSETKLRPEAGPKNRETGIHADRHTTLQFSGAVLSDHRAETLTLSGFFQAGSRAGKKPKPEIPFSFFPDWLSRESECAAKEYAPWILGKRPIVIPDGLDEREMGCRRTH
jgi:hypothetical protein